MSASYIPKGGNDLIVWFNNYKNKMNTLYGTMLGFTAAELTQITNDAAVVQITVQLKEGYRQASGTMITLLKDVLNGSVNDPIGPLPVVPSVAAMPAGSMRGVLKRTIANIARIKSHPSYSLNIGQDLSILPPASTFNPATVIPVLKGKVVSGYPQLSWKNGKADGVQLYVDRGDGNGFVLLAKRNSTSYIDIEPLPANTQFITWSYKAKYIIDDEEIGLESDIVTLEVLRV